jgi:hypothetical protein
MDSVFGPGLKDRPPTQTLKPTRVVVTRDNTAPFPVKPFDPNCKNCTERALMVALTCNAKFAPLNREAIITPCTDHFNKIVGKHNLTWKAINWRVAK